jgi:hypothetical protein
MCDVDVYALSWGVEEFAPVPTAADDLRDILACVRARVRRILRLA